MKFNLKALLRTVGESIHDKNTKAYRTKGLIIEGSFNPKHLTDSVVFVNTIFYFCAHEFCYHYHVFMGNNRKHTAMLTMSLCCLYGHMTGEVIGVLEHPLVCRFTLAEEQSRLSSILFTARLGRKVRTDPSRTFVGLIQHPIINHLSLDNVAVLAFHCPPFCLLIY